MPKYVCDVPCFHNGKRYRKGDIANFKKGEAPVRGKKHKNAGDVCHFRPLAEGPVAEGAGVGEVNVMVNSKPQTQRA